MRWFEYKTEVDALHAPEDLKARLRAMKAADPAPGAASSSAEGGAAGQPASADRTPVPNNCPAPSLTPPSFSESGKRIRIPWKRIGGMAACFACGAAAVLALSLQPVGFDGFSLSSDVGTMASSSAAVAPQASAGAAAGGVMGGVIDENGAWLAADAETSETLSAAGGEEDALPEETRSQTKTSRETRKIIYTASLTLESTEYDRTAAALQQALDAAGGYVESSESRNYGTSSRAVYYTLRVPAENYREFLAAAEGAGNLTDKTEDSQDITAAYVDVAARIESLQAQRARLLELEAQAGSLTDLLEIEDKLTDVQYRLESYQQQMTVYNDRVDYCTVTVSLHEVNTYTPVEPTLAERLSAALTGGLEGFAGAMLSLVLWLLTALPWLAVLALALAIAWAVRRRRRKAEK